MGCRGIRMDSFMIPENAINIIIISITTFGSVDWRFADG